MTTTAAAVSTAAKSVALPIATTAGVSAGIRFPTAAGEARGITTGPDGALWFTENTSANKIGRLALTTINPHDFNGDGKSDILWRDTSGNVAVWEMNGTTVLNPNTAGVENVPTTWSIVGQRDFNGDGK